MDFEVIYRNGDDTWYFLFQKIPSRRSETEKYTTKLLLYYSTYFFLLDFTPYRNHHTVKPNMIVHRESSISSSSSPLIPSTLKVIPAVIGLDDDWQKAWFVPSTTSN